MTLKLHANFLYKDRKDTYSRKMAKGKLLKCKYNEGKVHKLNLVKCLSTISLFGAKKHFGTQYVYEHWTNLSFAWNHGEFLSYLHFVNRSKCLYIYIQRNKLFHYFFGYFVVFVCWTVQMLMLLPVRKDLFGSETMHKGRFMQIFYCFMIYWNIFKCLS